MGTKYKELREIRKLCSIKQNVQAAEKIVKLLVGSTCVRFFDAMHHRLAETVFLRQFQKFVEICQV